MAKQLTRRSLILSLTSALPDAAQQTLRKRPELPRAGEFVRFVDPLTENTLVRLTAPSSANTLPAPENVFISVKNRFLVFSSDRTGTFTPHLLDLRSGMIRLLAETSSLDVLSLSLDQSDRIVFFLDGGKLQQVQIASRRVGTIAENITAFAGRSEASMLVIRNGSLESLKGERLATGVSGLCQTSPDGSVCLIRKPAGAGFEFWSVPLRPRGEPRLLASGRVRFPFWSPDSQSILFLRDSDANGVTLSEIHRVPVSGTAAEEKICSTGQFASFAPNGDATVFVGASRSRAQPTVDLLLRTPGRQMTLCEHRASTPSLVTPVFSPDSRRVYFQSDREGKSALYSINVELLVEATLS